MDKPTKKPYARRVLPLALLAVTGLLTALPAASAQTVAPGAVGASGVVVPSADPIPDEYIVTLRDDRPEAAPLWASALTNQYGGEVRDVYDAAVQGFSAHMSEENAAALATDPAVASVEEDGLVYATVTQQNPPSWGLDRIDQTPGGPPLDGAYSYLTTGSSVHAYVIDTGVRITHADFSGRATNGWDFVDNDADTNPVGCTNPTAQHGTHVAATLGGSTFGVAKSVSITSVRVLRCDGTGTTSSVIAGVDWVTDHATRPAVANMSLAGAASATLDEAVQQSIASGITYVVAAGNTAGDACTRSPARVSAALTVAATDTNDARASFSSFGSCVDVFAPGVNITSASSTGDTATVTLSGTSMATPHVSGIVARFLDTSPGAQPAEVADAVLGGALSGVVSSAGSGSPNRLVNTQFIDPPGPCAPCVPSAPGLGAAAIGTTVRLSWTPPVSDGGTALTGYAIYRGTNAGGEGPTPITTVGPSVTSYDDATGVAGTTYFYQVAATNAVGEGPRSNEKPGSPRARPQLVSGAGPITEAGVLGSPITTVTTGSLTTAFARGADDSVYRYHGADEPVTGWESLGGVVTSDPVAVTDGAGFAVFARGADNAVWWGRVDGAGPWSGWSSLGGWITSNIAAAVDSAGITLFVRGGNAIYYGRLVAGGTWTGWRYLGGIVTSDPVAVTSSAGITVVVRGLGSAVWYGRLANNDTWTGWTYLGGWITSNISATATPHTVFMFVRGGTAIYYGGLNDDGTWTGWQSLGGYVTSDPVSIAKGADVYTFVRGGGNAVYEGRLTNSTTWSGWQYLGGYATSNVSATVETDGIDLFVRGGNAAYQSLVTNNGAWTGWQLLVG